jgi:hypothetical protein
MTQERFHFTGSDGADYTLPKQIPAGALRKSRGLDALDQVFTILENTADEKTLAALDALDVSELTRVTKEWMQGMSAGESSASTN